MQIGVCFLFSKLYFNSFYSLVAFILDLVVESIWK